MAWTQAVRAAGLYASQAWFVTGSALIRLRRWEMQYLRRIFRLFPKRTAPVEGETFYREASARQARGILAAHGKATITELTPEEE